MFHCGLFPGFLAAGGYISCYRNLRKNLPQIAGRHRGFEKTNAGHKINRRKTYGIFTDDLFNRIWAALHGIFTPTEAASVGLLF